VPIIAIPVGASSNGVDEALRRLGHADRAGAVCLAVRSVSGNSTTFSGSSAPSRAAAGLRSSGRPLEVVGGDRDRRALEDAAQALQLVELGAQLELGADRPPQLLEHGDLLALPVARLDVGDAQRPDRAAAERQRHAGVGERLAGLDGRQAPRQLVLAGVVDDDRPGRADQLRQLGGADAGQRLPLVAGDHRHRRAEHLRGQPGEPLESGVLPLARAGHGDPIGSLPRGG
jgi:hypothetical protein